MSEAGAPPPAIRADGTVLGFDAGQRRIGVAVGSAFGAGARPVAVVDVHGGGPDWRQVERLVREWRPDGLVVGDPMTLDGGDQPIRRFAQGFARELAARFHDDAVAEQAVAGWHAAVRGEGDLSSLPLQDVVVPAEGLRIGALLVAAGLMPSNSEAGRKLKERAVRIDGVVFEDAARVFAPGFEGVLAVGKRNFARVRLVTA